MFSKALVGSALAVGLMATAAQGSVVRRVSADQARKGLVTVEVASGYGVNISFQRLPERLIRVWVDDVSELLVEFDRPFPETKVIHLRRLQASELPLQTRSTTGETLMTVVTEQHIYQFFIRPVRGRSSYKTIELVPGEQVSTGVTVQQIEAGLTEALRQERLRPDSALVARLRELIALLRQGNGLETASRQTGIQLATIEELVKLGRNRGRILEQLRNKTMKD